MCCVTSYCLHVRPKCAQHAMTCLARLVRAIFGSSAVSAHKLGFGANIVALGILITPKEDGFRCELAREKAAKCIDAMSTALKDEQLFPGTARKLAGRLSWASQFMFRRLGRAMLRPFFQRSHSSECLIDGALRVALEWWLMVLRKGVAEEYPWKMQVDTPAHLYVDARGVPPRYVRSVPFFCVCLVSRDVAGVQLYCSLMEACITRMASRLKPSWTSFGRVMTIRLRHWKYWLSQLGCPALGTCCAVGVLSSFLTIVERKAVWSKGLRKLGTNACSFMKYGRW